MPISARNKEGIDELLETIARMVHGEIQTKPTKISYSRTIEEKIAKLLPLVKEVIGDEYPARWIALRLLDGDTSLLHALQSQPHHLLKGGAHYGCHCSAKSI